MRVPTRLMAASRRSAASAASPIRSTRSRSRAPRCAEGIETLPAAAAGRPGARPAAAGRPPRAARPPRASRSTTRCSGICTICGPSSSCPAARCSTASGATAIARRLARAEQTMRVRIARDELRRMRELTADDQGARGRDRRARRAGRAAAARRARLRAADRGQARRRDRRRRPLLQRRQARPRRRPGTDPGQLGRTDRHRLDRGGNRQINAAIHRVAVTRARCHPETSDLHRAQEGRRQDPPRSASAASSATSPAASGTSCARPTPTKQHRPTINFLT